MVAARSQAGNAISDYARVFGDGGVVEQIARGEWDRDFIGPRQEADAGDLLRAGGEYARQLRRSLDALRAPLENPASTMQAQAATTRLPLNRKERYYTGTVFPMVVASDGFAHLDRLLALCGLPPAHLEGLEGNQDLQFVTEYSFAESVFLEGDVQRFDDRPVLADTPDIVLIGHDWLLAIEAKMFDQPSKADLQRQLEGQAQLVKYWASKLEFKPDRVAHVALLPASLARRLGDVVTATVTWEAVADAYQDVAPRFWIAVLNQALTSSLFGPENYGFRSNAHAVVSGAEIHAGASDSEGRPFTTMGRAGGLHGKLLTKDLASGAWRSQQYEVRTEGSPNSNWFSIVEFLRLADQSP